MIEFALRTHCWLLAFRRFRGKFFERREIEKAALQRRLRSQKISLPF
jgi:hypothetical protein